MGPPLERLRLTLNTNLNRMLNSKMKSHKEQGKENVRAVEDPKKLKVSPVLSLSNP